MTAVCAASEEDVVLALLEADVSQLTVLGELLASADEKTIKLTRNIFESLTTVPSYYGAPLGRRICLLGCTDTHAHTHTDNEHIHTQTQQ